MSSRPAKRARSNIESDVVDPSKLRELVDCIDPKSIANLLIEAAKAHPDVASLVQQEVDRIAVAERAKVLDFDYLSKSAWKTLNVTYDRMRDSDVFEMSGEVAHSIEGCFETIRTRCPETASVKTKESALETLRKIGKSICLSHGVVGREIRKNYSSGGSLVPVMLDIAESLTDEEAERLRPWCDDKLVELQEIADRHCIFEELGQVIELWGGDEEGEDEDEDNSNGNDEDEDASEDKEDVEDEMFVAGMLLQKHRGIL